MITIMLFVIAAVLFVAIVSMPVFLWWRWKRNERCWRENQLYSVYRSQMQRRRGDRQ